MQLTMRIFVSFTDANETRVMHTESDNIKIMSSIETNSLMKMKGSSFIFERIDLLEYHLHKISLNRGSSYIKSPEWIKNKGVTINPKNTKNNNCCIKSSKY